MYNVTCREDRTPSRGWYSIFSFTLSKREDYDELKWSIRQDEDVALVRVNLREFRDCDISEEGLDNLDGIIEFFRHHNREIIFRFVYDIDGNGLTNEPKNKKIIKNHMCQIAPFMVKNADIIITMQGTFTGSWGEMHSSRYSSDEDIADLVLTLYEATHGEVNIALRTPAQIRALKSTLEFIRYPGRTGLMRRIGLYDDAMLASDTDMGTFTFNDEARDIAMLAEISEYNFVGGECVNENVLNDDDDAVAGLRARHVTYLNSQYDTQVIEKWREQTVKGGMTVFDYLTAYLGYRLVYVRCRTGIFDSNVTIVIRNDGFAPFFGKLELIINDDIRLQSEANVIKPGECVEFVCAKNRLPERFELTAERVSDGKGVGVFLT